MTPTYVAGLDLGSTGVKILISDIRGHEVLVEQRPTPWRDGPGGTTELDAADLLAVVADLLDAAAAGLAAASGPGARIGAVAVSGMGETGLLLDDDGAVAAPAFAWFDPRGSAQVAAMPDQLREQFAGRTGLPLGAQVSVAKILHLREHGLDLAPLRWFSLPEYVARALGGRAVAEYSLASRTGLLDQDTGRPWPEMLAHLGVPESFLPPLVAAGTRLGEATAPWLPDAVRGAAVTVAGHDHLVAAVAGGTIPGSRYQVLMGTAEVLLRVLEQPLSQAARARLAGHLINCVRHVVPGQFVLVAGVKTGLLMRRALQLFGVTDTGERERLDAAVAALPPGGSLAPGAVEVSGARNDDGVLTLTIRADGASPAEVFAALLQHGNDEIAVLTEAMDREVPPATETLLSGGWAQMASVRAARSRVLPGLSVSARSQETAFGAAMAAAGLLTETTGLLTQTTNHPAELNPADTNPAAPAAPRRRRTMNQLTTRETRQMAMISTPDGHMLIVAADQRNGMKAVMTDGPAGQPVSAEDLAAAKKDLVTHLGNHAAAILLDPEVALPAAVDEGVLSRDTALVVGMDASGYEEVDGLRYIRFVPGVSPARVLELGGDVAKMLWYLRTDRQGPQDRVASEIRELVAACEAAGLLLIVEILVYRLEGESEAEYAERFPGLVADAARFSVECGAKVLKLQYPGSAEASAAVTEAAAGVPWAVLSAGVDHETFIEQVRTAVANGASGAMAGRSLWKDSLSVSAETREELLTSRALPRLRELAVAVGG
ncbi:FGGY family carbohydrate kinase [Salana multivorans]